MCGEIPWAVLTTHGSPRDPMHNKLSYLGIQKTQRSRAYVCTHISVCSLRVHEGYKEKNANTVDDMIDIDYSS